MARKKKSNRLQQKEDPATRSFRLACQSIRKHPLFSPLWDHACVLRSDHSDCPLDAWATVNYQGRIQVSRRKNADPEEWVYVLGHCLLHLGFEHFQKMPHPHVWGAACDCIAAVFLKDLKLGKAPESMRSHLELPRRNLKELYECFLVEGIEPTLAHLGTGSGGRTGMIWKESPSYYRLPPSFSWAKLLKEGITNAVSRAMEVASGRVEFLDEPSHLKTQAENARSWFMSSYPLLGALAGSFKIEESLSICQGLGISVAAVDEEARVIYMNPAADLALEECRFVMAHELLHVGLRHLDRRQGRDPFLWNVACDYVINGWLREMQIGEMPSFGGLYDPDAQGHSSESLYDQIAADLRRYRKLATLAGRGQVDMLETGIRGGIPGGAQSLDDFYRNQLAQGLIFHEEQQRGFLPLGLVEEIRALSQPSIPWEVKLARWFDGFFSPLERRRTFARPSRRQASTPGIPRPRWVLEDGAEDGRTFGVVIDTSGSMDRVLLGKALGAVASYASSREVPGVRVVCCDAAAYDQGYLPPEELGDRFKLRGRGGTILQPGVELLKAADDFPKTAPILIITDGWCDPIRVNREHAYLLPEGRHLPFRPKGPVFRMK